MKKFSKKLLFPLAIATMGITSCKPYAMTWHIITKDKAYQSIASIKNKQETLKFPRPCSLSYNYSHLRNGNYVSFIYGFIDYDYDSEYLKILDAELDSSQGMIECHILYMLKGQDGRYYRYVPTNDSEHTKKEVPENNFKNEIEDEVENDTLVASPEYCIIGHFDFKKALCGHIFIERKTKESVEYFDYNENVLDEINHYVTTSDKISSEHKGSSTITSEYYFQAKDEGSLEYNEVTKAPGSYYYDSSANIKSVEKNFNIKFINNFLSTANYSCTTTKQDGIEDYYEINFAKTNVVVKDKIII